MLDYNLKNREMKINLIQFGGCGVGGGGVKVISEVRVRSVVKGQGVGGSMSIILGCRTSR